MTTSQEQTIDTGTRPTTAAARESAQAGRLWEVDLMRGVAIILMVFYHFSYDLDQFGDYNIGANAGNWRTFASVIAFMFIFLVGVSLVLSFSRAITRTTDDWALFRKYLLRGMRVFGYGLIITVAVMIVAPYGWIVFGILHLIGVSIILAYPFLKWPRAALPAGLTIFLFGMLVDLPSLDHPWLLWLGFRPPIDMMFDYRPLLPWFGPALLGIYVGNLLYPGGVRRFSLTDLSGLSPVRAVSWMGRKSLAIYMIHQPLILVVLDFAGVIDLGLF